MQALKRGHEFDAAMIFIMISGDDISRKAPMQKRRFPLH
jgi:hypothetical protein